jgi:hypothetical protein
MDFHVVEISFPFEWQPPHWRHHPASFLSHFVGHEGPGSLFSYLKQKGWATALSAGQQNLARGFAMFKTTIHLTEVGFGMSQWRIRARIQLICPQITTDQSSPQHSSTCLFSDLPTSSHGDRQSVLSSRGLDSASWRKGGRTSMQLGSPTTWLGQCLLIASSAGRN